MPTASDLVTDLPADFETFGQAVATSMADLLGGTTGQVLSKASNTDMDFTWVAQDDSNAIQNAIVDAKGDLIAATAADTPARLAVGTNGQVLTADSTASTGLAWATPTTGLSYADNGVLNSAMQIWQRGTSITGTTAGTYSADRWFTYRGASTAGYTTTRQATNDTTNLPNIQYCARLQRDSGNTSTQFLALAQSFETINSIPFVGKTVTLSFYARRGANFSPTSNLFDAYIFYGTGTDQSVASGYTGVGNIPQTGLTATTTWQRFSFTGTIPTTATEIAPYISFSPTGTAGANDYLEVTGVMLEVASTATSFHTNQPTLATELAACQRYYYLHASGTSGSICNFLYFNATTATAMLSFPVAMRTAPTLSSTTGSQYYVVETGSNLDYINSLTLAKTTTTATQLYNATEAAGTVGLSGIGYTNNASANLAFSAEL
jgi:hypothetical protein